jgi:hypothetical protein
MYVAFLRMELSKEGFLASDDFSVQSKYKLNKKSIVSEYLSIFWKILPYQ